MAFKVSSIDLNSNKLTLEFREYVLLVDASGIMTILMTKNAAPIRKKLKSSAKRLYKLFLHIFGTKRV